MPFKRTGMYFKDYEWSAREGADDPRVTGTPDSTLLNREEGYEVLYFVNTVGERNIAAALDNKVYQKIERMIRRCPPGLMSQKNIENWILENWFTIVL